MRRLSGCTPEQARRIADNSLARHGLPSASRLHEGERVFLKSVLTELRGTSTLVVLVACDAVSRAFVSGMFVWRSAVQRRLPRARRKYTARVMGEIMAELEAGDEVLVAGLDARRGDRGAA